MLYAILEFLVFAIAGWYEYIHIATIDTSDYPLQAWGAAYQIVAIFGAVVGLLAAKKWDGYKSLPGRAVTWFSIGLFLQSFGQSVYSYYNFFQNAVIPYPSLGDIGFMGSVIVYIIGAFTILKASGFQFTIRSYRKKLIAVVVPVILLISCYVFFLYGYVFDWPQPIKIFLDFAYPLGQAVYISIVLVAYLTSLNYSLGAMKYPLLLLLIALTFQYISDFTFLYQANAGTWHVGGINDFLYFISYSLMAFSLLIMGGVRRMLPDLE